MAENKIRLWRSLCIWAVSLKSNADQLIHVMSWGLNRPPDTAALKTACGEIRAHLNDVEECLARLEDAEDLNDGNQGT
jgi:hypothetical protein